MSWANYPDFEALLSSPENECQHGRCPGDKSPRCGCWTDLEGSPPVRLADARSMAPSVLTLAPRRPRDILALMAEELAA